LEELPERRWRRVAEDFKDMGRELKDIVRILVDAYVPTDDGRKMVYGLADILGDLLPQEMKDEIRGYHEMADIEIADLVLYNLIYDLTAFKACTSIIAQDDMGHVFHGRNLDYSFSDFLRRSTILLEFQDRRGKVHYGGVGFAFYVGLLTGQKPEGFTISLDERDDGKGIENVIMAFVTRLRHPVGWFIREVLAEEDHFESAVRRLSDTMLIAPAYFIVGGQTGQGAVITRDRLMAINVWRMDPYNHGEWYLVETNYDHWKPAGDKRRDVAKKMMDETGQRDINDITLYNVLSTDPVKNKDTVFTTIMSAHAPSMMLEDTMVREDDRPDAKKP